MTRFFSISFFLFLAIINVESSAQNAKTYIALKDIQGGGIEKANIQLESTMGDLISNNQSDKEGKAVITAVPGLYKLVITHASYQSLKIEQLLFVKDSVITAILLPKTNTTLDNVTVTASRPPVEYQLDKKVYNIDKELLSKGGTGADVLTNIPSVNIDPAGVISYRGNTAVRILINGKPSQLAANNGIAQIPASTIEKVEVTSNPSAQYEATGGAGIINIVLKKNKTSGFNGSLQTSLGHPANYGINANLSYKTSWYNLFSNIGYSYRNLYFKRTRYQEFNNKGAFTKLYNETLAGNNERNLVFYLGGDLYFNDNNTLTGSFYHDRLQNKDTTLSLFDYYNSSHIKDSSLYRFEKYREPQHFNELELNYVKTFRKEGARWTTNLLYDFWNDDENQLISERKTYPVAIREPELVTRDIESSKDIYVQSNLVLPFSKNKKLEAGIRADLRALRSDYQSTLNNKVLEQHTNKLYYNEHLYRAYVQWGNKWKKLGYLLGLRSELTDLRIYDRKQTFDENKYYLNLFPTLHASYSIDSNTHMQLSYSRRINRPQFSQLNIFGGLSDTRNLTVGNPDLDPMYTDSYEIGLLSKTGKLTLNPTFYFKHSTQNIEYALKETQPGYFVRTPINLEYENRMGIELATQYVPFKWWRLMLDANYFRFRQKGNFENKYYNTSGQTWFGRLTSKTNISKIAAVDLAFDYQGSVRGIQTFTKPIFNGKLGMGRDFAGDKLSVNLTINNLFNSRIRTQITQTEAYYLQNRQYWPRRQITTTLTYRFNRKKEQADRLPGS